MVVMNSGHNPSGRSLTGLPLAMGLMVAFTLSGCGSGGSDLPPKEVPGPGSGLEASVAQYHADLQRWAAFGFSGAVLVARDDRILLSSGYGYADRAQQIPITPQTQFDIASLGKAFTAAAILVLRQEDKLDLRDSIAVIFPDLPPDKAAITVHHLLTHTAGIEDFGDENEPVNRDTLVKKIFSEPLVYEAGTTYAYSNLGYSLLAAIIEILSGQAFEDFLTQALFEPAGLQHTTFTWLKANPERDRIALGYGGYQHKPKGENPHDRTASWRHRGGGNVISTTEDLLRWYRALRSGRILDQTSLDLMFKAHTTAEADFLNYGYAWRMQKTAGGRHLIWHSGLETPYSAMLRDYQEEGVVFIFLSNLAVGGVTMREVLVPPSRSGPPSAKLFAEAIATAPDFSPEDLDLSPYMGRYRVGENGWWQIGEENGTAILWAEGQEAVDALFPPADEAVAAAYRRAGDEAVRIADCLLHGQCPDGDPSPRIDPYGYANRDGGRIADQWRERIKAYGELREIRNLGTTALRGRRAHQLLTQLQLVFAKGSVDEHVIWYADDEIYWIPGRPATLGIHLKPGTQGGWVGFDLLKQVTYRAVWSADNSSLTISQGERKSTGLREH